MQNLIWFPNGLKLIAQDLKKSINFKIMKNLFLTSTFLLSSLMFFYACSEEDNPTNTENSIEQQIVDIHKVFLTIKDTNPTVSLTLSIKNNKLVSLMEVPTTEKLASRIMNRGADPDCQGDGLKFVKCVKKLLDAGNCVIITTCSYCAYVTDCP